MTKSPSIPHYNQDRFGDDDFVASFVARHNHAEALLNGLRHIANAGPTEHQILVGARGMGKTSLLRRLAIGIMSDPVLRAVFIPLRFREEQYNIISLDAFWRNCGESLAEWCEEQGKQALADRLDIAIETPEWRDAEKARDAFLLACAAAGGRAILLLDNLDLIVEGIKPEGGWLLRAALQMKNGPIVIGAATRLLAQGGDRNAPFYEFFHPHILEPLTERELLACLNALASQRGEAGLPVKALLAREPERARALYVLTGGNPRILGLIYGLLEQSGSEEIFADLEALLDQVTPFYKAQIESYQTPLQRAVIDGIALNWDPITSGVLSQQTGIEATTLSAQLNRLKKDGLIEEVETSGTRTGYQLAERFLNIWYLMRHGTRKTKQRLRWFTAFLTKLFSTDELGKMADEVRSGNAEWSANYCEAVIEAYDLRRQEAQESEGFSKIASDVFVDFSKAFSLHVAGQHQDAIAEYDEIVARAGTRDSVDFQEQTAMALLLKGVTLGELERPEEEIAVYDDMVARFGASDLAALREQVAMALLNKGITLGGLERPEEEITVYDDMVARFGASDVTALREQVAKALFNKGVTLGQLEHPEEEIAVYDDMVARFGASDVAAMQERVAKALLNKGITLGELERPEEEIAVYDDMVARFGASDVAAVQERVAKALLNKGITLGQLERPEEEIAVYDDMVARFGASDVAAVQERVAKALLNKGITLGQLEHPEAAIAVYDDMVARFGASDVAALQEQVAKALFNKGITLGRLEHPEEAIAVYDDMVVRFGASDVGALPEQVAKALLNKGITLSELERPEEAMAVYDDMVARFGASDVAAVQERVAKALLNKGITLGGLDRPEEAMAVYDDMVVRFGARDVAALQEQVAKALLNKGITLGRLERPEEAMAVYDDMVARFGASDVAALQAQVARALLYLAKLWFWSLGRTQEAITAIDKTLAIDPDSDLANANLLWMLLANGEPAEAQRLMAKLDSVKGGGRSLMHAGIDLSADNLGASLGHLRDALEQGLSGDFDFSEDLLWYLRIADERGFGEKVIDWFVESGNADRYAPVYAAFVALVRGERFLLDLNPEVRGVAQPLYAQMSAGKGGRRDIANPKRRKRKPA